MSAREWVEAALTGGGCLLLLLACAGLLVLRDPLDRLHLPAAASAGAVLIAVAAIVRGPLVTLGVRGALLVVILVVASPIAVVATARAVRVREHGAWERRPGEPVEER